MSKFETAEDGREMGLYSEHSRHLIGEFWKLGLGLIDPFLRKKKIRCLSVLWSSVQCKYNTFRIVPLLMVPASYHRQMPDG
jgi:hypothetical protein